MSASEGSAAGAVRAFLGELIDDAGLFPPANLSMADALAAHERAEAGEMYWMLGRFVVPASRLDELLDQVDDAPDPLALSVVLDGDVGEGLASTARRARDCADRIAVEAFECRLTSLEGATPRERLATLRSAVDRANFAEPLPLYVELGFDGGASFEAGLAAVRGAAAGGRSVGAKLRCGGVTAESVPTPAQVAEFVCRARELDVPFKATAGLHHPVRHFNRDAGFTMHGFLNVVGAAVLARAHPLDAGALEPIVADEDPTHFALDANAFRWRDLHADAGAVGAARASFIRSYGSCSFDDPVEDLRALGILERART